MIKFKLAETRKIQENGSTIEVPVLHEVAIRPQDIQMWDVQTFTMDVKKDIEQEDGTVKTVDEKLVNVVLAVTMNKTVKNFKEVEVPYFKKAGEVHIRKEIREVEENITYYFSDEEKDDVLSQLEAQIV